MLFTKGRNVFVMPPVSQKQHFSWFASFDRFFADHKHFSFFTAILIALAVPLTVGLLSQQTIFQQHADAPEYCTLSMALSPSSGPANTPFHISGTVSCNYFALVHISCVDSNNIEHTQGFVSAVKVGHFDFGQLHVAKTTTFVCSAIDNLTNNKSTPRSATFTVTNTVAGGSGSNTPKTCKPKSYTECERGNPTWCLSHGVPKGTMAKVQFTKSCVWQCTNTHIKCQ